MSDDWGALAEHHADRIFRAARSLVPDDESAWDCVQEAFLTAVTTRQPDDLTEPVAWLCGVARNHARHQTRGQGRFRAILERLAAARLSRVEAKGRDSREALTDGLSRLSPRLREAVVLRYFGRMSLLEVARMQGISETAAKSRVHRGLARLRAVLGPLAVLVILVRETARTGGDVTGELLAAAGSAVPVGLSAVGGGTALKFAGALLLVILGATVFTWLPDESPSAEPGPAGDDPAPPALTVGVVPGATASKGHPRQAAPGVPPSPTATGFKVTLRDLANGAVVPDLPVQFIRRGRVWKLATADRKGVVHLRRKADAELRPVAREWRVAGEIVHEKGGAADLYVYRMMSVEGTVAHKRIGRSRDGPQLFAMPIGLPGSTLDDPTPDPWHPEWLAEHGIARSVALGAPSREGRFVVSIPAVRGMAVVARAPECRSTAVRIDPPAPGNWAERVSLRLDWQRPVEGELKVPARASRSRCEVQFLLTAAVERSEFHPEELGISGQETFFVTMPTWKKVLVTRSAVAETGSDGRFAVDLGGVGTGAALFLSQGSRPILAIERRVRVSDGNNRRIGPLRARALARNDWLRILVGGAAARDTRLLLYDLKSLDRSAGISVSLTRDGKMPRGILERGHRYLVLVIGGARRPLQVGSGGILEYKDQKSIELTTLKEVEADTGILTAD